MAHLLDFKEPKRSKAIIGICRVLFPLHLKVTDKLAIDYVQTPPELKERLKGKPVVMFLNHPDRYDPLIAMSLAEFFKEDLHCIAAREVFDWDNGRRGWLFQKLGCYSVNRGARDTRSIQTTKRILTRACHKLAVFPEAEITGDTSHVHDFQRSMLHLILCAQKDIARERPDDSVLILPVATSYQLETDVESSVAKVLRAVERRLNSHQHAKKAAPLRAKALVADLLKCLYEEYKLELDESQSQAAQTKVIAEQICLRINRYMDLDLDESQSTEQFLHCLRTKVSERIDDEERTSTYHRQLYRTQGAVYQQFLLELDRVERLLIGHRILSQPPSPFQICRVVDFLELETTGKMTAKGRQRASVCIGEPIEVLPFLEEYMNGTKELTIDKLTSLTKECLQKALNFASGDLVKEAVPTPVDDFTHAARPRL
ncbi:MAG: 1-acyl-sn-glycerol-3-phosphate acyltransferase [Candidatus Obscuribacterales bacterium]|nr:1-acyl-sn-glycerol-3-phosphate acyltransferase [Candidatus Obscuribacterales bacterium]